MDWDQAVDAVLREKNLEKGMADSVVERMGEVGFDDLQIDEEREGPLEPYDLLCHCQIPFEWEVP